MAHGYGAWARDFGAKEPEKPFITGFVGKARAGGILFIGPDYILEKLVMFRLPEHTLNVVYGRESLMPVWGREKLRDGYRQTPETAITTAEASSPLAWGRG